MDFTNISQQMQEEYRKLYFLLGALDGDPFVGNFEYKNPEWEIIFSTSDNSSTQILDFHKGLENISSKEKTFNIQLNKGVAARSFSLLSGQVLYSIARESYPGKYAEEEDLYVKTVLPGVKGYRSYLKMVEGNWNLCFEFQNDFIQVSTIQSLNLDSVSHRNYVYSGLLGGLSTLIKYDDIVDDNRIPAILGSNFSSYYYDINSYEEVSLDVEEISFVNEVLAEDNEKNTFIKEEQTFYIQQKHIIPFKGGVRIY